MTVARVQSTSGAGTGTDPLSLAYGSDVVAGNLLLLFEANGNGLTSNTVDDTVGSIWSKAVAIADTSNGLEASIWWAVAAGSGPNTVNVHYGTTNTNRMALFEVSGCTATPFDQVASQEQHSTAAVTSTNTPATTVADEYLAGFIFLTGGPTGLSATGAWVIRENAGVPNNFGAMDQIVAATGTYAATGTNAGGNGANSIALIATFKAAPSGQPKPWVE